MTSNELHLMRLTINQADKTVIKFKGKHFLPFRLKLAHGRALNSKVHVNADFPFLISLVHCHVRSVLAAKRRKKKSKKLFSLQHTNSGTCKMPSKPSSKRGSPDERAKSGKEH